MSFLTHLQWFVIPFLRRLWSDKPYEQAQRFSVAEKFKKQMLM